MEPLGRCQVQEAKDESEADIQPESALKVEETRSKETGSKVMDEETKRSADHDHEYESSKSEQEAHDDTQLGQDHSARSVQQEPTNTVMIKNQHQCDVCKKIFTKSSSLLQHQRTHSGEKPYECGSTDCDKTFSRRDILKLHQQMHSRESPYKCDADECDKAFSQIEDLRRHQRTHSGESVPSEARHSARSDN